MVRRTAQPGVRASGHAQVETAHRYPSGNRPAIEYRRWHCPAPNDRLPLVLIRRGALGFRRSGRGKMREAIEEEQ
jgi:hypothetical protein